MTDFHERLIGEKKLLDEKLERLCYFFGTERYAGLGEAERSRLRAQSYFMVGYSSMLGERLAALEGMP